MITVSYFNHSNIIECSSSFHIIYVHLVQIYVSDICRQEGHELDYKLNMLCRMSVA